MQFFGLHVNPNKSAAEHYDVHVVKIPTEAMSLLYLEGQYHSREWTRLPIAGPPGEGAMQPWKLPSKGHRKHPCAYWILADERHAWWVLQYGLSLCREYTARFATEKTPNPVHRTEYHLRHVLAHTPPPLASPPAVRAPAAPRTVDSFRDWLASEFGMDADEVDRIRVCTSNPPQGCLFGVLAFSISDLPDGEKERVERALADECSNDWVASYRLYYSTKRLTFKRPDQHLKKHRKPFLFSAA